MKRITYFLSGALAALLISSATVSAFAALGDPVRREILSLLRREPMAAGDIAAHFDLSGATVSHHLAILRDAGLVLDDRQGKYIYYELNMSVVDEILEWVSALRGEDRDEKNE